MAWDARIGFRILTVIAAERILHRLDFPWLSGFQREASFLTIDDRWAVLNVVGCAFFLIAECRLFTASS
jgi:hypothetical protein